MSEPQNKHRRRVPKNYVDNDANLRQKPTFSFILSLDLLFKFSLLPIDHIS